MAFNLISFERVAVGFLFFSATGVSVFARSSMTWENLLMPLLLGALALAISWRYSIAVSQPLIFFMNGYVLLFLSQSLFYGSFHPKHLVLYPLNVWVAYCFVRAMRERFLFHLEYLITRFSAVSLGIWVIDVITDGAVRQLLSGVFIGQPYNEIVDSYIVVHTFINEGVDSILPRNSGFAWEPGAFAVFCCLGLMINLYRTNFRVKGNFSAAVLLAAILSSQSTTGYNILLVFLLIKLWRDMRGISRIILPILATALVVSVFSMPFMLDKINNLMAEDLYELAQSATSPWNLDRPLAAQRFLSLQLDFADFLNNPWTGYGGQDSEMFVEREALNIVSISGIGKIMARFGILGIGFFVWSTALSSVWLSRQFCMRSPILLASFIFMVSISYSLIEHPLFLSIWSYWFLGYSGTGTSGKLQYAQLSERA